MDLTEKQLTTTPRFHGVVVDVRTDTVRLPDGREAGREVVMHPGGVAILPLDENGEVIMVRQFRYAMGEELLEVPAGKLEPDEPHRPAALRELEEEVGVIPEHLDYLGGLYVSPGISTEIIHLYLATGLTQGTCHPDEDEFLKIDRLPLDTLVELALNGELKDAKTAALVMKVKLLQQGKGTQ